ncbi:hypothetical protein F0562_016550 [Nyssa sinensis]|uniref:Pentatricopeptide repeat-containing protein n=1 Tax=Nyssa sinensis TaxID=561372 RepID=A0A5J4ZG93_9ASTE|nr:hypothetical protein F0562_016550 [Nyssa sinensis]
MEQHGICANHRTCLWLLEGYLKSGSLVYAKKLHRRILKSGFDAQHVICSQLIYFYVACGDVDNATEVLYNLSRHRDGFSYNSHTRCGFSVRALQLFEKRQLDKLKPDCITVTSLLSACASVEALIRENNSACMRQRLIENVVLWNVMLVTYGRTACSHVGSVFKGLKYFKYMSKEHGLVPKPEHYACVVDILGRAGFLFCAREFIGAMPIEPDIILWRTLIKCLCSSEEPGN